METVEVASYTVHTLFAGLWTGAVLFVTLAILPVARDGMLNASPLHAIAGKLKTISRVSALALLATGSHMAAVQHTSTTLFETQGGWLVLSMVGLWLFLMAAVEIGAKKLTDGTGRDKVREPAHEARLTFLVASALAALLLVNAGLLSANTLGYL